MAFESSTQSRSASPPARAPVAGRSAQRSGERSSGDSATTAVITSGPRFGPYPASSIPTHRVGTVRGSRSDEPGHAGDGRRGHGIRAEGVMLGREVFFGVQRLLPGDFLAG